jgi:hypothetical protein
MRLFADDCWARRRLPPEPLRRAAGALLLAGACAAPRPPAAPTRFEAGLLAALAAEDPEVRAQALNCLARSGDERHVAAIGARIDDPYLEVRRAAIAALGSLAVTPMAAQRAVPFLQRAMGSSNPTCRQDAVLAFWWIDCDDWSSVVSCLADVSDSVRLSAAGVLVHHGVPIHPRDLAGLLATGGAGVAVMYARVLDGLVDPAQRDVLAPWLAVDDPRIRVAAGEAAARLDAIAHGAPTDWRSPARQVRDRAAAENNAGQRLLRALPWHEAQRDELRRAVASARLVLFGEAHSGPGPLRDAQRELLCAFAGNDRSQVVVGYEPSAQPAQQSVLDFAAQLGIRTRPLEVHWQTLVPEGRHAERDDEAAAAIADCLAEDPAVRLFVLRGVSHVLPGGHLLRQLPEVPLLILSFEMPQFAAIGDEPQLRGRTFRLGDGDRLWWCGVDDTFEGAGQLRDWLAAHPAAR